jgi:uncharacterized membrane protein
VPFNGIYLKSRSQVYFGASAMRLQTSTHSEVKTPIVRGIARYCIITLLVLGVIFRFANLGGKVYWPDEALTSLRISGYTRAELINGIFTNQPIDIDTIQRYQHPVAERGWAYTFNALKSTTEHTPLYFILARLWVEGIGRYSTAAIRSLSAVISLLSFPCLFWLCWELFRSARVGWIALSILAVTPLHLLYAQEARPYCLWTVCTVLSSAALLRAIRLQTFGSWAVYASTLALGLYTQLLFAAVILAHGLYLIVAEEVVAKAIGKKQWFSKTFRSYLLATAAALIVFSPWIGLMMSNIDRIHSRMTALAKPHSLLDLLGRSIVNLNRVFLGDDLHALNIAIVLLVVYAFYFICRHAPLRVWLFVLALTAVPFLLLAFSDVILSSDRALRIRYLIPSYIGIGIALAYLFEQMIRGRSWQTQGWRLGLIGLLVSMTIACSMIVQSPISWNKGVSRSAYYLSMPALINQASAPLLVGDSRPSEILALSYWLKPHVKLQLISDRQNFEIASGFDPIFLINPSPSLRNYLTSQGHRLSIVYKDPNASKGEENRLWQVHYNRINKGTVAPLPGTNSLDETEESGS